MEVLSSLVVAVFVLGWVSPASAETFAEASARGTGAAFLFALTAGLLTALTPCVYPMIPITVSIFGAKTGTSRPRAFVLATFYVAGIATMFGSLGTAFALLGRAFGTFLANPWVVVPLCLLFAAMALSMFGAFELSLPQGLQQRLNQVGGRGLGGAFLMGLVGGIIAAPCTGPPLAGILAYVATTRDAVKGFGLMATYAAGIGVPFWAIAGFSMSLPRSGRWMESVKSVLGIALLVASLFYLKNVAPALAKLTGTTPAFLIGCLVAIVAAVALGAIHLTFHDTLARGLRKGVGVAMATLALFAMTNYVLTPKGTLVLPWLHSEPQALAAARTSGRPLLVDFSADWCLPCKELEVKVFAQQDVALLMKEHFVLLKVDVTREEEDPELGKIRERYQADNLPAVRVVSPSGDLIARLDDANISPSDFVKLLTKSIGSLATTR
jgi:thiol:disulfide interchange protein DsbD